MMMQIYLKYIYIRIQNKIRRIFLTKNKKRIAGCTWFSQNGIAPSRPMRNMREHCSTIHARKQKSKIKENKKKWQGSEEKWIKKKKFTHKLISPFFSFFFPTHIYNFFLLFYMQEWKVRCIEPSCSIWVEYMHTAADKRDRTLTWPGETHMKILIYAPHTLTNNHWLCWWCLVALRCVGGCVCVLKSQRI